MGDEDAGRRCGERGHVLVRAERAKGAIARATIAGRLPVDLEDAIDDVDDLVVLDAVAGVQGGLPGPIELEPCLRDFNDEDGLDRVALEVLAR